MFSLFSVKYSETLNKEYIERIHQMSYSSLSDNRMLQIFSFLIKWLPWNVFISNNFKDTIVNCK